MALTPEIDGLVARIAEIEAFVSALDGTQPIIMTIGTHSLTVDPTVAPEPYGRGIDVLKGVAQGFIVTLREGVASTAIAQSQAV